MRRGRSPLLHLLWLLHPLLLHQLLLHQLLLHLLLLHLSPSHTFFLLPSHSIFLLTSHSFFSLTSQSLFLLTSHGFFLLLTQFFLFLLTSSLLTHSILLSLFLGIHLPLRFFLLVFFLLTPNKFLLWILLPTAMRLLLLPCP